MDGSRINYMKSLMRMAAGKVGCGRKKAAQNEADNPFLETIAIVVLVITAFSLFALVGM